ncbi:hypothetical protein ASPZODRAFT_15091 [Penicilliopsis zonata CBS 506.65]|uniref:C2 NT-type domain-containing protein n=1 Tax=Penicilliopsis zonata CBS 506.65 TaxID=1073090 RepID=A0A1L9SK78_9EURO|nr:hypothetical protein ASPZODRAFT_15091 [Penicilliopsis zonata CBS 506.65]OJJ47642.1 hypothetical protein ASPZODRAFT_15091 [Penicilliopsis zonata CBS 506.65]
MQAFVPKNRRPRFELNLRINDLNNIPLTSGTAFVKWSLSSSNAAENHGHTDKAVILEHRAYWNYERNLQVRLTVDRNQGLQECFLNFEIIQEFASGGRGDKNLLGRIKLNLAEYVDRSDEDDGITRRYLMHDSKINSTLKLGIAMRQIDGERNFTTPPLKSAMVFSGIAGVVSASEPTENDDLGRLPSIITKSREVADMQDIYRSTLAASWNSPVGELPADKLIEDLFAGGSGWAKGPQEGRPGRAEADTQEETLSHDEVERRQNASGSKLSPKFNDRRQKSSSDHHYRNGAKSPGTPPRPGHSRRVGSIEQGLFENSKGNSWISRKPSQEVSEFDVRQDLRSWEVSGKENQPFLLGARRHDVTSRLNSSSSDAKNQESFLYRYKTSRGQINWSQEYRADTKIKLDVDALGKPGEIVVISPQRRRSRSGSQRKKVVKKKQDRLPLMLRELGKEEQSHSNVSIEDEFEKFRSKYKQHDTLSLAGWIEARKALQSSFTMKQLSQYIDGFKEVELLPAEEGSLADDARSNPWKPSKTLLVNPDPMSQEHDTYKLSNPSDLKAKEVLAETILRACWRLGFIGQVGHIDIQLSSPAVHLLSNQKHFSFEELANMHEANIEVSHTSGVVRVTGAKNPCESIRDIVLDNINRMREQDIALPRQETFKDGSYRVFTKEFLNWVDKTYGVYCRGNNISGVSKILYLAPNKQEADDARRTLNLALYSKATTSVPFCTYIASSKKANVYTVSSELNVPFFDRNKQWFRWALPSAQSQSHEASDLKRPLFDAQPAGLSNRLLQLLISTSPATARQLAATAFRETITATVGKCLFLRKPSFNEQYIDASELGQISPPRIFLKDVPRISSFLRLLTPFPLVHYLPTYRIRLTPPAIKAKFLPKIEAEVAIRQGDPLLGDDVDLIIRNVNAIVSETSVDHLLPENTLDVRFTRHVYYQVYKGADSASQDSVLSPESINALLDSIRDCLRGAFPKNPTSSERTPTPISCHLAIPNKLVLQDMTSRIKAQLPEDETNQTIQGEYMFSPLNDILTSQVHQYDFQGERLNCGFYESGPFLPSRSTDIFLDMDVTDNIMAALSRNQSPAAHLQDEFKSFYNTSCKLAFELGIIR